jgi:hypothetical protein
MRLLIVPWEGFMPLSAWVNVPHRDLRLYVGITSMQLNFDASVR